MKYLAILKDSFRETRDSKLLYVTLGLSGLLLALLASVSFRPVSVDDQLQGLAWMYNLAFAHGTGTAKAGQVTQTNDAPEPWHGDYRFTVTLQFADADQAKREGPTKTLQLQFFVREVFWWLDHLEVRDAAGADKSQIAVEFSSRGTKLETVQSWRHEPGLFFGAVTLGPLSYQSLSYWVYWIENRLVNTIGAWVAILIGIVVTASFIPNMLQRGTVDLLLVKPINRWTLLVCKYLGGLTFMLLNAVVAIGGVWLVLGLRTGIWAPGFLLSTLIIVFFFAVLYSISAFVGVVTRSTIISILLTCLAWFVFWLVGTVHAAIHAPQSAADARMREGKVGRREPPPANQEPTGNEWFATTVDLAHKVMPRTGDLGQLTTQFLSAELLTEAERSQLEIQRNLSFTWAESIGVCCAYIIVMLSLACWRFSVKDY